MTRDVPQTLLVMLSDEQSAGKILVELEAFIRFNEGIKRQVDDLEALIRRQVPQLAQRGLASSPSGRGPG